MRDTLWGGIDGGQSHGADVCIASSHTAMAVSVTTYDERRMNHVHASLDRYSGRGSGAFDAFHLPLGARWMGLQGT